MQASTPRQQLTHKNLFLTFLCLFVIAVLLGCGGTTAANTVAPEDPAPVISGVAAANISTTTATVVWTTDIPSSSKVDYGTTTNYGSSTTLDATETTQHTQTITDLTAGTVYHYRVRAKGKNKESVSGDGTFTTGTPGTTVSISISPTTATLTSGTTRQFSATVSGSSNGAVTWNASGGTVNTLGLYTAPATPGSYTVTATSAADTTKTATATVTVNAAVAVTISPASGVTLQTGQQRQFTATVTGSSNTSVTWTATGGTVTSAGLYTAPSTAGSYTVKATSVADPTKSASSVVTVTAPVAVSISPTSASITTGGTQQFTATVTGSSNTSVTWTATGGTVSAGGLFTAPATAGSYTVTATSVADTTKSASATVTVSAPGVVAVTISPTSASVSSGATRQFTATVTGSSNTSVTWSTTGGTVSSSGLFTAPATAGSYTVKATSVADTTKSASAAVTVTADTTAPTISAIFASPTANSAIVSWNTNEAATSQVEYGTSTAYGSSTTLDSTKVTNHSVSLSGLSASTLYHYRVKSNDAANNASVSADNTFTTPAQGSGIPGTTGWFQLSNTQLQNVCPLDSQGYDFSFLCQNVIRAWSGGIADTKRNRLIMWGGGHTDYYGNEVYSLNLSDLSLTRLNNPSPIAGPVQNPTCIETLSDNTPNSRHTYSGMTYIAHADKMFIYGGSLACAPGHGGNDTWTLDLPTMKWTRMDPTGAAPVGDQLAAVADYNPNDQMVYLLDRVDLFRYNLSTNSYTDLGGATISVYMNGVIDPKRNLFVLMGMDDNFANFVVQAIDLKSGSTFARQTWTTTGCNLSQADYPGMAYDPVQDRIVVYPGSGNTVWVFNPDTKTCTQQSFSGGPPTNSARGVNGRFRYFPSQGVFAYVGDWDQNAFTLRMTGGSGTPAAPVISAVSASSLSQTGATITWNTDVVATSQVEYGLTTSYGNSTTLDAALVTSHLTLLGGMQPGTPYHYRVRSKNSSGTETVSSDATFSTTGVSDTTPPTVSITSPAAGATVTGTTSVAVAASDNVGVVGVQLKVDGTSQGAEDTVSPFTISWNSSGVGNGAHSLTVVARDAAGNSTTSSAVNVTVSNTATTTDADYAARCSAPGVFRCWNFDDATANADHIVGKAGFPAPTIVTDVKSSGTGSLMFTVASQSHESAAGYFWLNFADDFSKQFGPGQDVYLQWRQRFSPEFLSTYYQPGDGWKQVIIGEGDRTGYVANSCTDLEIVMQNVRSKGIPRMYISCNYYTGLEEYIQTPQFPISDVIYQNGNDVLVSPYCRYNNGSPVNVPPCVNYQASQWMTFQVHIKPGTWWDGSNGVGDPISAGPKDGTIEAWAGYECQPSKQIINFQPSNRNTGVSFYNSNPTQSKYGKVWFLPYMTNKDATQVTPTGYIWYDELVISTQKIPDPKCQ